MKESYIKGVANYDDPDPASLAARSTVKRGIRACTGRVLSREIKRIQSADAVTQCGRQHEHRRYRKTMFGSARSMTPCMYRISLRENRESSGVPNAMVRVGRVEKAKAWSRR